jgi:alpha-beta hydrolase superfamily lysophospholipase
VIASGYALSAPVQHAVGAPPPDIKAQNVQFPSTSGSLLHGWIARGVPGQGVVILMHGVHADRRSQLNRMRLLLRAEYSVLAFDFQAHGESLGHRITFGHLEGLDAEAAVRFAKQQFPGERVGVIGQSLGGAAMLLAPRPLPVDAMILESVYPDIDHALCHRFEVYLGRAGCLLTPIYTALMPAVIGVRPSELRPIDRIGTVTAPVLVIAGAADNRTTLAESKDLFAHAKAPKEFWGVSGAGHVDILKYDAAAYARHVMPFLAKYLRGQS